MPTLIERILELSAQIRSLADSQVSEDEAKGFATRAEEYSGLSNVIAVPARRFELLTAKGMQVETPSGEARVLKGKIDEVTAKYDADTRSILAPNATWRHNTRNQLASLAERVNTTLSEGWRTHVLSLRPVVDQGLLSMWRISPAHTDQAIWVEDLSRDFDHLAERLPVTQEEIDRPEQLSIQLRLALEELPPDYPQPVRELFSAINKDAATAAHLTDEAVQWLRENELLDRLRISWERI